VRALVTGSARGLGLALCTVLAEQGYEVLATCRTATAALEAVGVTVVDGVDLADDDACERIRAGAGNDPLDLVVCNAGVNLTHAQSIAELDLDQVREEYEVNTIGPLRTIQAALPLLHGGSKIALISTYRPGVGVARRNYGYQASKMATNQIGRILADELADRGILTVMLSPGPMDTELMRSALATGLVNVPPDLLQDPLDVARDLLACLDSLTPGDSGSWLFRTGEPLTVPTRVFGH
jgi:NAD(P)-dependent dehydrogenase (short-subunit alcohol dehydrogenase family)